MPKNIIILLTLILMACLSSATVATQATALISPTVATLAAAATRTISDNDPCLHSVSVRVGPDAAIRSYAVEEHLPPALLPLNVTENGIWDSESRTIRWGPFADGNTRIFTYEIEGMNMTYNIFGIVSLDGQSEPIGGDVKGTINCTKVRAEVATPNINPPSGTHVPVDVTMSCETEGAMIHYTIDGSLPDKASPLYSASLHFTAPIRLRARAFKQDMKDSDAALAIYTEVPIYHTLMRMITFNQTCEPQVLVQVRPAEQAKSFALEEILSRDLMPYKISEDGVWDVTNNSLKWGPFLDSNERIFTYSILGLPGTYAINGKASFDGAPSPIPGDIRIDIPDNCDRVETPTISPKTGTTVPVEVTILCSTPDADIRYTLDGSEPDIHSPIYTAPLQITTGTLLQVKAYKEGLFYSKISSAFYPEVIILGKLNRTIINNDNCSANVAVKVMPDETIACYAVEEILPFELTPSDINEGGVWDISHRKIGWGPFLDSNIRILTYELTGATGDYIISGKGSFDGSSEETTGDYHPSIECHTMLKKVKAPVFTPPTGTCVPVIVTITCETPDAQIRYTTDGSIPDMETSLYTGPLQFSKTVNIRARAFKEGIEESNVVFARYPEMSEETGLEILRTIRENETCAPTMRIEVTPDDSTRSYAVEETLPFGLIPSHITGSGVWDAAARSIKWGPFNDHVGRIFTYRITGIPGSYTMPHRVSQDGASRAFTDNNTPLVIKCYTETGLQKVTTPAFDPPSGAFVPLYADILCETTEAVIHYTTDGTLPDRDSPIFTNTLYFTTTTNLRARAFKNGMEDSEVASATYPAPFTAHSEIQRIISDNHSCSPSVSITIIPDEAALSYAVEESIPFGLSALDISHSGMWDSRTRRVRWGPFTGAQPLTLTYSLSGELSAYTYTIEGKASFDGQSIPISGDAEAIIDCKAPKGISVIEGNGAIYISWEPIPSASGYKVYYGTSSGQYTDVIDAKGIHKDFALQGLSNGTSYYITVTAYDLNGRETPYAAGIVATPSHEAGALGLISFDREFYNTKPPSVTAVITLKDADLNIDPEGVQNIDISITSSSDSAGITITLSETGLDTGIFTSAAHGKDLGFTLEESDDEDERIRFTNGDTIMATYHDNLPHSILTAKARVDNTPPVTTLTPSDSLLMVDGNHYAAEDFTFSLSAEDAISGVDRIEYSIDGSGFKEFAGPFPLGSDGSHTIQYKAIDKAGNWEEMKERRIIINSAPPSAPSGLAGSQADFTLTLTWTANKEPDVKGYHIYRNDKRINTAPVTSPLYEELITSGKTYVYHVTAVDWFDHESPFSAPLTITTHSEPPKITGPDEGTAFVDEELTVRGIAEPRAYVEIFVNGLFQGTTLSDSQGHFSLSGVRISEGENSITAVSTNAYGVTSTSSAAISVGLNPRPQPISGLTATPGDTIVTLSWDENPENDIAGYFIYRDTVLLNHEPLLKTEYIDIMLTNGRIYSYTVTAVDNNGSKGNKTDAIPVAPAPGPLWE